MKKEQLVLFFIIILFTCWVNLCVNTVSAQHIMASTAELTEEAENIVRGTVKDMKSKWNDEKTFIWTFVTVSVTETTKGDSLDKQDITVKIPGGVVENVGQRSDDEVVFEKGEDVLLFLKKEMYKEKEYFQVVRLFMGKYTFKDDEVVEKKVPVKAFMDEIKKAMKK
ncbi:MAG: hypothetical protein JSW07_14440 [bacterium]|nr:MAG: hypothetical protein JSW07_14440 [bacterium]